MSNTGKKFEENWKASVPKNVFYYRFRDSATSWSNNGMTRFTISNIADCMLYDDLSSILHLIELKSIKGKSIPLAKIIGNKTKLKQILDLKDANKFNGIFSNIIVFFSDLERCFSLDIFSFSCFTEDGSRKSIPVSYFEEKGIEIEVIKLKTNYRFNIEKWLKEF